jgi:hypothetical protein
MHKILEPDGEGSEYGVIICEIVDFAESALGELEGEACEDIHRYFCEAHVGASERGRRCHQTFTLLNSVISFLAVHYYINLLTDLDCTVVYKSSYPCYS